MGRTAENHPAKEGTTIAWGGNLLFPCIAVAVNGRWGDNCALCLTTILQACIQAVVFMAMDTIITTNPHLLLMLTFSLIQAHQVKFGYSEKATKFEKNLPLKIWRYSVTSNFKWKIFFQILWPFQNIRTLIYLGNISILRQKKVMGGWGKNGNFCWLSVPFMLM